MISPASSPAFHDRARRRLVRRLELHEEKEVVGELHEEKEVVGELPEGCRYTLDQVLGD